MLGRNERNVIDFGQSSGRAAPGPSGPFSLSSELTVLVTMSWHWTHWQAALQFAFCGFIVLV